MGEQESFVQTSYTELHIVLLLGRQAIRTKVLGKLQSYHFTSKLSKYLYLTMRKMHDHVEDFAWQTLSALVENHFGKDPDIIKSFSSLASYYSNIISTPPTQLSQYFKEISRFILYQEMNNMLERLTTKTWDSVDPAYFAGKLASLSSKVEVSHLEPVPMDKLSLLKRYSDIEHDESNKILSSIPQINSSLLYSGYKQSDLIMVMAGPGIGKTTFMMQEAVSFIYQGIGVAYFFLGDMSEHSISLRFLTQLNNMVVGDWSSLQPPSDIVDLAVKRKLTYSPIDRLVIDSSFYTNVVDIYSNLLDSHLKVYCLPALTVTVDEIISEFQSIQNTNPNIKVLILDYDLNLIKKMESMYEEGSYTYARLSALADSGNLVLVATQTKNQYWDSVLPPLEAAAESSRKQHAIDVAISIGKYGHLYLCKVREGIEGVIIECNKDLKHSCYIPIKEVTREEAIRYAQQRRG